MGNILITSLVSNRNQKPRIDITMDSNRVQMSADEAMNVAKQLIECAQGSYADAFLYHFLLENVFKNKHTDENKNLLGHMVADFREFRDKLRLEFEEDQKEDKDNGK